MKGMFSSGTLQKLLDGVQIMPMAKAVRNTQPDFIDSTTVFDVVSKELIGLKDMVRPGMKIAVAVGSRGIDCLPEIIFSVCRNLEMMGACVSIVPCMGSHGGNAAGQKLLLKNLGISEETMQVPVVSEDNVTNIGIAADGRAVYVDDYLLTCDGIVVVNRIKAHTAFSGPVESGLQKMMAIGFGKQKGAASCHIDGFVGMSRKVQETAAVISNTGKVFYGLGIIENYQGKLCQLHGVRGDSIQEEEPKLLKIAKDFMPKLPFAELDFLIVDEIGKDISGSGMDTHVIGRYPTPDMHGTIQIDRIAALSLTSASGGCGHGTGFADFISARLFDDIVFEKTYINGLTNRTIGPAAIPMVMPNDRYTIQAGIYLCRNNDPGKIRAARIKNTHCLDTIYISPALIEELSAAWEIVHVPDAISFETNGRIVDEW